MTFTPNEIALLVIALLIGLLLGLILSGRGKYKRYWRDEQLAHAHAVKDRDARLADARERIAELERHSVPPRPAAMHGPAGSTHERDDFSRIRGITPQDEIALNQAGYHRYDQIAAIGAEQEAALETQLGLRRGVISREEWREQARLLDARQDQEHARLYEHRTTQA
ncbi:hypothetical protein Sj15T_09220 [Sphingobium sp. TA15]|uniref:Uncharacterized protein n=1 Tax=Sphingobium indicum (strain DSM 16413 / CCM 7287 / MTCC 6362 / UT26 / NBRC 101211 / UT26S) TaxID=452662 RepID=D4Z1X8_SPHIU|nr:hypothetical protein [Sphingobium indicum]BAI96610.1 conserved hypothetical protein [Sphingobium indicum UT26S]BDD65901.1 hypothetical protein Sj15T_09220 [Sphingobium sp. TA15]